MRITEAVFGLHMLALKCLDQQRDLFVRYAYFEKVFDRVPYETLTETI